MKRSFSSPPSRVKKIVSRSKNRPRQRPSANFEFKSAMPKINRAPPDHLAKFNSVSIKLSDDTAVARQTTIGAKFKTPYGPAKCPANPLSTRKRSREKLLSGEIIAKNRQPRNGFAGTVLRIIKATSH